MSAKTLREAAEWLRKRAARMPAGPYGMHSAWTSPQTMLSRVTSRAGVIAEVRERHPSDPMRGAGVTDYLSYLTPEFALSVADWLDATARELDALGDPDLTAHPQDGRRTAALTVARAYLGTPAPP